MSLFLGLDVGTQGTKGVVIDSLSHEVVGSAAESYGLIEGLEPGACEQHPETWVNAVGRVCRKLGLPGRDIQGIGVSGQQHGLVVLDEDDRVIRPAKLWCDTATVEEAEELSRAFGRRVPVGYTASKILWLLRHEPEHWKRVRHVLLPHDYINFVLCGEKAMELGDASGTGLLDPVRRVFRDEDLAMIDPGLAQLLPPLLAPGEFQGRLSAEGARLTGLREGIPVAQGGGDNMMSAIGSGATRP
ncbi:MAG: FGGY family carbohydrate kinase, partial [Planctomycetota bacterium]